MKDLKTIQILKSSKASAQTTAVKCSYCHIHIIIMILFTDCFRQVPGGSKSVVQVRQSSDPGTQSKMAATLMHVPAR